MSVFLLLSFSQPLIFMPPTCRQFNWSHGSKFISRPPWLQRRQCCTGPFNISYQQLIACRLLYCRLLGHNHGASRPLADSSSVVCSQLNLSPTLLSTAGPFVTLFLPLLTFFWACNCYHGGSPSLADYLSSARDETCRRLYCRLPAQSNSTSFPPPGGTAYLTTFILAWPFILCG